jgi:tripartite-type tricarboxylate transporter receptor subunit TctC
MLLALATCAAAPFAPQAQAQPYPTKPARIIFPYAAGGDVEQGVRPVANHLSKSLGQSFVVESRPGASTMIGTEAVAKSAPDGHTLLFTGSSTFAINPTAYAGKLPYDYQRDFTPVGMVTRAPFIIVVRSSLPAKTLQEFIALAKSAPGSMSFATSGAGATNHLGWEILMRQANISLVHVPFKGLGVAMPDILGGRVTTMMSGFAPVQSSIRGGQLRALAVTTKERFSGLPEVPTVAESGLPGYENITWFAIFAPAGTPAAVVATLNAEIRKFLATPEAKEAYHKVGQEPAPSTAEELAAIVTRDRQKYERVLRQANIKFE